MSSSLPDLKYLFSLVTDQSPLIHQGHFMLHFIHFSVKQLQITVTIWQTQWDMHQTSLIFYSKVDKEVAATVCVRVPKR